MQDQCYIQRRNCVWSTLRSANVNEIGAKINKKFCKITINSTQQNVKSTLKKLK